MQLESIEQIESYDHVFISPHYDDVALSCGGVALAARDRGERVLAIGVFVGRPRDESRITEFAEFQHERWGGHEDPWEARRAEERSVMAQLQADFLWLSYLDAIYRGAQYLSDDDLFGVVKPGDIRIVRALTMDLLRVEQRNPEATIYVPLGVGGHVDHQICCIAADDLLTGDARVAYYEDVPYALQPGAVDDRIHGLQHDLRTMTVEIGSLVEAKIRLVESYTSQTDWIFRHYGPAAEVLRSHATSFSQLPGGYAERLWIPKQRSP